MSCWQAFAMTVALGCAGCDVAETSRTQVYVLVDLSKTWQNDAQAARNRSVLSETGFGIALAADVLEPPLTVQIRPIGAASLEREPICDVVYVSKLAPARSDATYEITKRSKLERYLGVDCPATIVARPSEPLTEISAAILSVTNQPKLSATKRYLVILSDFLEETSGQIDLPVDLTGFDVLLVYRPITNDYADPRLLRSRLKDWARVISDSGGSVITLPDTALKRRTIASYLSGEFKPDDR